MNKRAGCMGLYFTQSLSGGDIIARTGYSFPQFTGCLCNLACQLYSRHIIGFSGGIVRSDFLSLSLASALIISITSSHNVLPEIRNARTRGSASVFQEPDAVRCSSSSSRSAVCGFHPRVRRNDELIMVMIIPATSRVHSTQPIPFIAFR